MNETNIEQNHVDYMNNVLEDKGEDNLQAKDDKEGFTIYDDVEDEDKECLKKKMTMQELPLLMLKEPTLL
jgi:hypothetical protein